MVQDQPPPIQTGEKSVWQMVIEDMHEREQVGIDRYGTPLTVFNGRKALVDAYQEALDLAVYLRQRIEEDRLVDQALHAIEGQDA